MIVKYRHIAYAEAEAEKGPVEKLYDSDKSYMSNAIYDQNITPEEWAAHELKKFENDKQKGIILEFEVINPDSMPPLLQLIKKVTFTELLNDTRIGPAVDQYFKRRGWDLRIVRRISKDSQEGYQVYFGKGVQVDNHYEYGFSCLFEEEDVIAFAGNFFMDKVLKEDMYICPICGEHITPGEGKDIGYGDLQHAWSCANCRTTGSAIVDTYNNSAFVRHELD